MRLLTFEKEGRPALGVKLDGGVVDVAAARQKLGDGARQVAGDVHAFIRGGAAARDGLRALVEQAAGDDTLLLAEADLRLGPCVTAPERCSRATSSPPAPPKAWPWPWTPSPGCNRAMRWSSR